MARCENCIYFKMCYWIALYNEKTPCEHFMATADFVPKSKYDLAVAEREANVKGFTEELAKIKSEVAREILDELYKAAYHETEHYGIRVKIVELKKKYTEEN